MTSVSDYVAWPLESLATGRGLTFNKNYAPWITQSGRAEFAFSWVVAAEKRNMKLLQSAFDDGGEQGICQRLLVSSRRAMFVLLPGDHRIRMHPETASQFALALPPHCSASADALAERHFRHIEWAITEESDDPWEVA